MERGIRIFGTVEKAESTKRGDRVVIALDMDDEFRAEAMARLVAIVGRPVNATIFDEREES